MELFHGFLSTFVVCLRDGHISHQLNATHKEFQQGIADIPKLGFGPIFVTGDARQNKEEHISVMKKQV